MHSFPHVFHISKPKLYLFDLLILLSTGGGGAGIVCTSTPFSMSVSRGVIMLVYEQQANNMPEGVLHEE